MGGGEEKGPNEFKSQVEIELPSVWKFVKRGGDGKKEGGREEAEANN